MSPAFLLATALATCTQPLTPGEIRYAPEMGSLANVRWVLRARHFVKTCVTKGMSIDEASDLRVFGGPVQMTVRGMSVLDGRLGLRVNYRARQRPRVIGGEYQIDYVVDDVCLEPLPDLLYLLSLPEPERP
jgi:hypothetical protein